MYNGLAPNTSYTVPTGYTAVIRQISACAVAAATFIALVIQNSDEAPAVTVWSAEVSGLEVAVLQECRFVVPEGGTMSISWGTFEIEAFAYVGGYLLTDSPG